MTQHVLLAGCGDVGMALGERLSQQGWAASGIRRSVDKLPENITPIPMDLTNPGDQDLPKADAVVITLTADGRDVEDYRHTYLGALKGLHQALQASGIPPRVVLVSSTGVLGNSDGTLTEDAEPHPTRDTAKVLLEAEHLAQQLFPGVIIVRPAGIYGPGRTSLINRVRQGSPMDHARITNRIHRDDLVSVLHEVLEAEQPPSLLHAVDTEPARMGDVAAYIAGKLNVPVPPDKPGGSAGKRLDSSRMQEFVSALRFPTYREGYDSLLS
ncbi:MULTISPECIES: NAD(P)H-binding protein [Kocuria]|uniref:NAD(P)H-binding protein n=1 Tax=Kocuria subflava TaxID=1736139 RepID=A0A846U2Y3_9MICC|nr:MULTISPECIES: NAD(P)H-binding protein [Kocuria]NKE10805.1 NAD(P)H-binding protein [Kocuria subflava]